METTVLHLRITPDEAAVLDAVAGKAMSRQSLSLMLMTAAIQAALEAYTRFQQQQPATNK